MCLWIKLLLVAESDRFEREDRFAGLVHGLDFLFKASGGCGRAKSAV